MVNGHVDFSLLICMLNYFEESSTIVFSSVIWLCQTLYDTTTLDTFMCKTMTRFSYIVDTMAADDLTTQKL